MQHVPALDYRDDMTGPTHFQPEQRLLAAMVERAVLDYAGYAAVGAEDRRTAEKWLFPTEKEVRAVEEWSFPWVLVHLGYPPDVLPRWQERISATMVRNAPRRAMHSRIDVQE